MPLVFYRFIVFKRQTVWRKKSEFPIQIQMYVAKYATALMLPIAGFGASSAEAQMFDYGE